MASLFSHGSPDSTAVASPRPSPRLADRVSAHIVRRTCGQVRELLVEADDDRIVLRGRSRTYHIKQLAQEAALLETGGWPPLLNEIVVF